MRNLRPRRPSGSMVVAMLALFLALGGTAIAQALIGGRDIRNGSITGRDIRNGSITGRDIRNGTITGAKVKNGTLTGAKIRSESLTGRQIDESTLGQVPSADDADQLGGQPASAYQLANRWVLIQGTATGANVLAQSGGFSVQRVAIGSYVVTTGASVSSRPIIATINGTGGLGLVVVAPCGGTANNPGGTNCPGVNNTSNVLAQTFTQAGAAADRTFYLVIGG